MSASRQTIALVSGIAICLLVVTPYVLAIKSFDWGVGLVFVSAVFVWLLLRVGQALERWARNEPDTLPPDPDYPDDTD